MLGRLGFTHTHTVDRWPQEPLQFEYEAAVGFQPNRAAPEQPVVFSPSQLNMLDYLPGAWQGFMSVWGLCLGQTACLTHIGCCTFVYGYKTGIGLSGQPYWVVSACGLVVLAAVQHFAEAVCATLKHGPLTTLLLLTAWGGGYWQGTQGPDTRTGRAAVATCHQQV